MAALLLLFLTCLSLVVGGPQFQSAEPGTMEGSWDQGPSSSSWNQGPQTKPWDQGGSYGRQWNQGANARSWNQGVNSRSWNQRQPRQSMQNFRSQGWGMPVAQQQRSYGGSMAAPRAQVPRYGSVGNSIGSDNVQVMPEPLPLQGGARGQEAAPLQNWGNFYQGQQPSWAPSPPIQSPGGWGTLPAKQGSWASDPAPSWASDPAPCSSGTCSSAMSAPAESQPRIPDMSNPVAPIEPSQSWGAAPLPQPWTRSYTPIGNGRCGMQCKNRCPLSPAQPSPMPQPLPQPLPSPCQRRPVCQTKCNRAPSRCPIRQPSWNQGRTTVCGLRQQQQQQQQWQQPYNQGVMPGSQYMQPWNRQRQAGPALQGPGGWMTAPQAINNPKDEDMVEIGKGSGGEGQDAGSGDNEEEEEKDY